MPADMDLARFIADFARGLGLADRRRPQCRRYLPGIGPFDEPEAIRLVFQELAALDPVAYDPASWALEALFPGNTSQRLDIRLGPSDAPLWAIEVKMMRLLRNNGDVEPSAVGHLLSPHEASALVDCEKLVRSFLPGRKAILIYGFDYDAYPLQPMLDAFELLARLRVRLIERHSADFAFLVHPHHRCGSVVAWEIASSPAGVGPVDPRE